MNQPQARPLPRLSLTLRTLRAAAVALALLGAGTAAAEAPAVRMTIGLPLAKQLAAVAEAEAKKNGWTVVIALVDESGHLVFLEKIDETQYGSIEVAQLKARSAVAFKRPTKAFEDAVMKDGRTGVLKLPEAVPVEGGLPLTVDGKIIGGIGISGMTSAQDGVIAQAVVDALPGIVKQK